jgi:hypothetical protein
VATAAIVKHAKVLKIDKPKRELTLKTDKGDTLVVPVKPEVKTFDQIKAGDRIKFTYSERLTVQVDSSAVSGAAQEVTRADAKPGTTPSVAMSERVTYAASITAIDQAKGTVTLRDATGEEFTLTPLHPENLANVSVGERVVFTATQSVAAQIVKEPAKKPASKPAAPKK